MKRKTIQLAGKTLVVSLPVKWCRAHGVQKGDELEVTTNGPSITINTFQQDPQHPVEFDASTLSERALRWALSSMHKKGFTEMTIIYNKEQMPVIQDVVKHLMIGFAIVEQRKKSCVIRAIAKENPEEFDTALRRAFLVTLSMGDRLTELLRENNFKELEVVADLEKTNNQLTNFCQRLINLEQVPTQHAAFRYVIAWNLEKIADEYKYICNQIKKSHITDQTINLIEQVNEVLRNYYQLYYKFDANKLTHTAEKAKILQNIAFKQLEKNPNKVNHHIIKIIAQTLDFSASIIALQ